MPLAVGLLVLAAVALAVGAELFAEHAASAGRRLGISGLAVGLLLAGAEPEELVTAVVAVLRGQPGIAGGDAIGADVTLLTLVLGSLALATVLELGRRGAVYALAAAVAGGAAWLTVLDGTVSRAEGLVLVGLYVVIVALIWWREQEVPAFGELGELHEDDDGDEESAGRGLALALAGVLAMGVGGWLAVAGAERIVIALGVGGSVVGLTLVALATTSEFVALIPAALRRGIPELAAAGIVGSVIYNATITLGVAAVLRPLDGAGLAWPAAAASLLALGLAGVAWRRGRIARPLGVTLVVAYGVFAWLVWR